MGYWQFLRTTLLNTIKRGKGLYGLGYGGLNGQFALAAWAGASWALTWARLAKVVIQAALVASLVPLWLYEAYLIYKVKSDKASPSQKYNKLHDGIVAGDRLLDRAKHLSYDYGMCQSVSERASFAQVALEVCQRMLDMTKE